MTERERDRWDCKVAKGNMVVYYRGSSFPSPRLCCQVGDHRRLPSVDLRMALHPKWFSSWWTPGPYEGPYCSLDSVRRVLRPTWSEVLKGGSSETDQLKRDYGELRLPRTSNDWVGV
jgi:hypothetical protein